MYNTWISLQITNDNRKSQAAHKYDCHARVQYKCLTTGVKYVNSSEPRTLRQLLRRVCRACSTNSWRFPFTSSMGMEQLPSPIKEAIVLISPPSNFVTYVTTFVNISFSCSFHSSIMLLTSFSPPPLLKCF
jgi:hypothetical protein